MYVYQDMSDSFCLTREYLTKHNLEILSVDCFRWHIFNLGIQKANGMNAGFLFLECMEFTMQPSLLINGTP